MYTRIYIHQNIIICKIHWCDFCDREVITFESALGSEHHWIVFQAVLYFETDWTYRITICILCTDNAL